LSTLNAGDTKKFLDQVLGFYTLTEYSEQCKILKSNNLTNIKQVNITIGQLESQVQKLEELSNMELIVGDITDTKETISTLVSKMNDIQTELRGWVNEKTKSKNELLKKQASVLTLGKNKKKEIDFIEKGTCPTCGAPIDQSQLEVKKKEKDLLLEQYNEIGEKVKVLDGEITNYSNGVQIGQIDPLNEEISRYKKLLTRLEEQAKRLNVNRTEIDALNIKIDALQNELTVYQAEDAEWQQLYDILAIQIRSKILNSFIPALNKNILHYSQRLHLPYIVQFDSNFKCNISLCGIDQVIPVSSLSTGQLKTVDMVIILGVLGTVIGSNGINILFLDELFSNLDAGLRNEMCQLLRESLKPDSTIFIISHTDLEDKYFDGNIHMKLELKDQYEKHSTYTIKKFEGDH
jgi:DNA repair exonuclease SbcCD ATPase subunit